MSRVIKILAIFLISLFILYTSYSILLSSTSAIDPIEELQQEIEKLNKAREMSIDATKPLEQTLEKLNNDLNNIIARVKVIEADLAVKRQKIEKGEEKLGEQEEILAKRVRSFYIRRSQVSPLAIVFSKKKPADFLREFAYQEAATNEDKRVITEIVLYIKDLEEKKKQLKNENYRLDKIKQETDRQAAFFQKEIAGAKAYQEKLTQEIASLTTRQQQLLAAKTGTFTTSVGEVPLADDPAARPDFNPGFSPAFAGFSFGAPHRKGMSQYGAYGRAKDGQSAEQILQAYYGDIKIETRDLPGEIETVVGVLPFEENYMLGIAEMPSSWDANNLAALKAQAIAARSYAVVHGKPICIDEGCQVYNSGKAANPPENWKRAVEETRGKVVVSNQSGQIVNTWYASTAGGYTFTYSSGGHRTPGGWDTSCGNQSCWTNEAYEKKAGSPWFYKAWYKSRGGETCGRSHPWLNNEEFADILNAIIVSKNSSEGASHIFPIDVNPCFGKSEDVWSREKMREEAGKYGGAVTSITSISVSYSTGGYTERVTFQTNRGELSFSGEEFRTIFNLRAPGRLWLASSLYNFEKK